MPDAVICTRSLANHFTSGSYIDFPWRFDIFTYSLVPEGLRLQECPVLINRYWAER